MTNFLAQFSQFHFLRPDWFWLLIPLLLFWILKLKMVKTTQWHQVIPAHLANAMLGNKKQNKVKQQRWLVPFIWSLAVIALAGPTWEKIEKPVFQVKRASVIVLDMSMSMRATDIKPNRLSKARYKAIDLANAITDGEVALIAYAGDAFTISPLTPDTRNITALIPSLKPEIMPAQGSYPLLGMNKATELLQQAGYPTGDIYWITDGIDNEDVPELTSFAQQTPYRINIMTVGTAQGAPIKMLDNSLLKDNRGSIVIPKLNNTELLQLSNISNGVFVNTTATDADIRTLLAANVSRAQSQQDNNDENSKDENALTGDDWQEFGPYIILLILPFFLVYFRKGAGILMLVILPLSFTPQKSLAADNNVKSTQSPEAQTSEVQVTAAEVKEPSWLDYAFKTQDQIGSEQFNNKQFEQAAQSFENSQWKGAAAYKAGDYETALEYFSKDDSAQGLYNQGNALANLGKLDDAIKAYEQSLQKDPENKSAAANKKLLEQQKQQQEQQQQDQGQNQDGEQQQDQDNEQQQESDQGSDQESENGSDQESKKNNSEQQQSEQKNSDSSDSDGQAENAPEPTESENQETPEQQSSKDAQSQSESEQEEKSAGQETEENEQKSDDESKEENAQAAPAQLTQEQIESAEQQQKIKQLLRKVKDDPATLLRNKMILESRKRQQGKRTPKGATKSW